jgi:hypothetical protein
MKKLILFITMLVFVLGTTTSFAEEKPQVAVLYVNNAKTTYDADLDNSILNNLAKCINPQKYVYINGTPYIEKLKKAGIDDISMAERADIVDAFSGEGIDYIVFLEVQPLIRKEKISFFTYGIDITAVVPFKVIDLATGKYLYNGKFSEKSSESTAFGGLGNKSIALKAIERINQQIATVLSGRLPASKIK